MNTRWRHKCPGCKRVVHWERVYCKLCILADPRRANFKLLVKHGKSDRTSYRKGPWLGLSTGMDMTRNHLFAMIRAFTLCVECGHKVNANALQHRCYFLTDAAARTLRLIRCRVCRYKKAKHLFPLFKRRSKLLRARVCSDCLHGLQFITPVKRKYERKHVVLL